MPGKGGGGGGAGAPGIGGGGGGAGAPGIAGNTSAFDEDVCEDDFEDFFLEDSVFFELCL